MIRGEAEEVDKVFELKRRQFKLRARPVFGQDLPSFRFALNGATLLFVFKQQHPHHIAKKRSAMSGAPGETTDAFSPA